MYVLYSTSNFFYLTTMYTTDTTAPTPSRVPDPGPEGSGIGAGGSSVCSLPPPHTPVAMLHSSAAVYYTECSSPRSARALIWTLSYKLFISIAVIAAAHTTILLVFAISVTLHKGRNIPINSQYMMEFSVFAKQCILLAKNIISICRSCNFETVFLVNISHLPL